MRKNDTPTELQTAIAQNDADTLLHRHEVLQQKYNTLHHEYQLLANSKGGRLTLWYWKQKDVLKARLSSMLWKRKLRCICDVNHLPSISIIIPTYRENPYLEQAVHSVLAQDYPTGKIRILIAVNGSNVGYAHDLRDKYRAYDNITILYTDKQSVGAARNHALSAVDTHCVCYLDDDDMFTPGYLRLLARCMTPDVSIVCGPLSDLSTDSISIDRDTYINRTISMVGNGSYGHYLPLAPLFSSLPAKLYRVQLLKSFLPLDERIPNSEDIIFWAENYHALHGRVCVCGVGSNEHYIRRLTPESLSRPAPKDHPRFYVQDRIAILERLESILLKSRSAEEQSFICSKMDCQKEFLIQYLSSASPDEKVRAATIVQNSTLKQKTDIVQYCK